MKRPEAIRPVADTSDLRFVRMMVYGEPGVGKSRFAGTGGPKTLILANRADETISAAVSGSQADQWVINDYDDLSAAYDWIRFENTGDNAYKFVWIDNLTLFQEQGMDQIMDDVVAARSHRSIYKPDKPEFGESQNRLGRTLREFTLLPIHLGLACHMDKYEDVDGNEVFMPMLQGGQGRFSSKICGYMNVVGYMEVLRDGTRRMHFEKTKSHHAKDRYDATPKGRMDDPTIPKYMGLVKKKFPQTGKKA
jgi:hypothetical protein